MSEKQFEPVHRRSLRETVSNALRQAIFRGDLKPGDRLREAQIAEQMGVSRAPLREAIRDLASEGLVVSQAHKGAYVAEHSASDLWEICTLRAALERMAVEIVARNPSPDLIHNLRKSIEDMTQAFKQGNIDRLVNLDLTFHKILCIHANHSRLYDIWSSMISQICVCIDLTHIIYQPVEEMIQMHQELVELIANRQGKEAGEVLAQHILEAGEAILQDHKASLGEEEA